MRDKKINLTGRVVKKDDIEHVLAIIKQQMLYGSIDEASARQFVGIVMFGAFTGQRPYSTIKHSGLNSLGQHSSLTSLSLTLNLTGQDRDGALRAAASTACTHEGSSLSRQGWKRTGVYARELRKWLQNLRIPLARCSSHFVTSDLRKFAEQHGDVVGRNESNRAYILTHGVRGIEWTVIGIRCLSTSTVFK
jgi:hypothetical protein